MRAGCPGYEKQIETKEEFDHSCSICFSPLHNSEKFCSQECAWKNSRKVKWPSKERLERLMKTKTWTAIGKKYGVSCNAVRKWARKYGLL